MITPILMRMPLHRLAAAYMDLKDRTDPWSFRTKLQVAFELLPRLNPSTVDLMAANPAAFVEHMNRNYAKELTE